MVEIGATSSYAEHGSATKSGSMAPALHSSATPNEIIGKKRPNCRPRRSRGYYGNPVAVFTGLHPV